MRRLVLLGIWVWLTTYCSVAQPRHIYLTWESEDTARTQTIVFQTLDRATDPRVELQIQGRSQTHTSKTVMFRGLPRRIHWVTLTGLKPATDYRFRAGDTRYGMSTWQTFRTLPSDSRPIRIVTGGDMYRHPETVALLKAAAAQAPDVALVGGDIAYADGDLARLQFWDDWLDNWADHMRHTDGRLIPMICAIGNHEVSGAFGQTKTQAPFYFGFLPQGGKPYFQRKLGSEIDLVVLDSGHVTSHSSQIPFLKSFFKESKSRFPVALYHVPCYPTHRPYNDPYSKLGRQYWVPIFDQFELPVAFENHDHVFKRTHPLKGGKVAKDGTVYLGDGCWGRTPRTVTGKRWYHAEASPTGHVWLVTNTDAGLHCQAVDQQVEVFDQVTIPSRR